MARIPAHVAGFDYSGLTNKVQQVKSTQTTTRAETTKKVVDKAEATYMSIPDCYFTPTLKECVDAYSSGLAAEEAAEATTPEPERIGPTVENAEKLRKEPELQPFMQVTLNSNRGTGIGRDAYEKFDWDTV